MGIEELLPKPSSFLPGILAKNMRGRYRATFNLSTTPKVIKVVGIIAECSRLVLTAETAYGKEDWNLLYAVIPYAACTYIMDRWSEIGGI